MQAIAESPQSTSRPAVSYFRGHRLDTWDLDPERIRRYLSGFGTFYPTGPRPASTASSSQRRLGPTLFSIETLGSEEREVEFAIPVEIRVEDTPAGVSWELPALGLRADASNDLQAEEDLLDQLVLLKDEYLGRTDSELTAKGLELKARLASLLL
jgi:hypothetical protein